MDRTRRADEHCAKQQGGAAWTGTRDGRASVAVGSIVWVTTSIAAVLVSACAATIPSASLVASESPSPSVSTEAPPPQTTAGWLSGIAVESVSVGTRGDEDDSTGLQPAELPRGELVWITDRIEEGGNAWLLVAAAQGFDEFAIPFGWLPERQAGETTLVKADLGCPTAPLTVPQAERLGRFGGLACYGSAAVELVGFTPLGCGAGGSPRVGTPDWLNGTWSALGIGDDEPQPPEFTVGSAINARAAPTGAVQGGCGRAGWYRFLGHFDDPASVTCRTKSSDGAGVVRLDPRLSQLLCRASLVLTDAIPLAGPP